MTTIHVKNEECHTYGFLPEVGAEAPCLYLANTDMNLVRLSQFKGKRVLISVYPSIETQTCFSQTQDLEAVAKEHPECAVLGVSMDLPFTLKRVAQYEKLEHIKLLSDFRNRDFGSSYGLTIEDGKLAGLLARCVLVIDEAGRVAYTELVEDVSCGANLSAAIDSLLAKS